MNNIIERIAKATATATPAWVKAALLEVADRPVRESEFLDGQAAIDFERWAAVLDEPIVLEIYNMNTNFCGLTVRPGESPSEDDIVYEVKTVAEWGKELAALEMEEGQPHAYAVLRMHQITRLLVDAGLIWRQGPAWWRAL